MTPTFVVPPDCKPCRLDSYSLPLAGRADRRGHRRSSETSFQHSAQVRYVVGVCALFIMIALPAATFAFYAQAGSALRTVMLRTATLMDPAVLSRTGTAATLPSHDSHWTTWVVYLWFAGVALSSLRIVVGWRLTRRLLQTASDAVPEPVKQTFSFMKTRMAFVRPVRLMLSEHIDGPAAIGWLKPVVLLPFTAITGLNPAQLQAVLAHELAHIRRHDFIVNVLQQCVESLLFYHPAVVVAVTPHSCGTRTCLRRSWQ